MSGDGLSFPVSEAVTGELYGAGQWVEANRMIGDEGPHSRLASLESDATPGTAQHAAFHHGSSARSMA